MKRQPNLDGALAKIVWHQLLYEQGWIIADRATIFKLLFIDMICNVNFENSTLQMSI